MSRSVIVTCAVTGSIHTPSQSPYLPLTPAQIIEESVAAAQAGAAVLHLHARNPEDGSPTADPEVFMQFLPQIRARCDAIINITTGGGPGMSLEERLAAPERVSPEMTSLNLGTMNFAGFMALEKLPTLQHEWERGYRDIARRHVFRNTFEDIDTVMQRLGEGHGVRFEYECYDVGQIYNLAIALEKRRYEPPLFMQFVLGIPGGISAELDHLLHMVRTAQRVFGNDLEWSVLAAGRHQMAMCTHAALLGGNVRVGLEDSLYIGRGELARSNADQVAKICRILRELSLDVATPEQARSRLKLKGADRIRL
ncbi:MAG TPA: 3-keto-5-aminohexanoate cleavage protein [Steroidobacteraceae bacterium]|nr:3-keto-5-aminohexanoate cleavage protein [Steroidobacteraceae bacterium]HXS30492.1 3-keto-5-aminohexanoate cleavage protein [Steroidobacteraceae bacterium]